jgi:uncharacterized membrane protein YfcA
MTIFAAVVAVVAFFAGSVGAVAGFGIGSILTPLVATQLGTKFAVAAVTIPHIAGSAVRFWTLRRHVNRRVLFTFGVMSVIGGVLGAFAHAYWTPHLLTVVLAVVLIVTGAAGVFGFAVHLRGAAAHCETPPTAPRQCVPFGRFNDALDGMIDRLLKPCRSRLTSLLVPPALPQQFTPRSWVTANFHP